MPSISGTALAQKCRTVLRRHLRERLVNTPYRLSRTGLPQKPYDGTDATVADLSNANRDE